MHRQAASRTLFGFALGGIGVSQVGAATDAIPPTHPVFADAVAPCIAADFRESSVHIEVDFIEFDPAHGTASPNRFAAKSTTLPRDEAEKLLLSTGQDGRGEKLNRRLATLTPGKLVRVSASETVERDETDPFGDAAGVTVIVGGNPIKFTTRTVGAELDLVLDAAGPEPTLIDATLRQTRFEGFVEYGGVSVQVPSANGGAPREVTVPRGFYQPIFSSATRREKLSLKPGDAVVLRVDWTDCKADDDLLSRLVPPPMLEGGAFKSTPSDRASKPTLILIRLPAVLSTEIRR